MKRSEFSPLLTIGARHPAAYTGSGTWAEFSCWIIGVEAGARTVFLGVPFVKWLGRRLQIRTNHHWRDVMVEARVLPNSTSSQFDEAITLMQEFLLQRRDTRERMPSPLKVLEMIDAGDRAQETSTRKAKKQLQNRSALRGKSPKSKAPLAKRACP